ncbi:MAG: polysaccharide lyase 8 family protein [bacterium]
MTPEGSIRYPTRRTAVATAVAIAALAVLSPPTAAAQPTQRQAMERIKQRIRAALAPDRLSKRHVDQLRRHAQTLRPDGSWPDIDYRDRTRSGWPVARHLRRLHRMAQAFHAEARELPDRPELKKKILAGIDHWLAHDYRNPNWWWNRIGVPMRLGRVLILMDEELSEKQLAAGIRIMKRSRVGMTGANLVWLATNQVRWGCLAGDAGAVESAFRAIQRETHIAGGGAEGIKPDRSFWQHGRCLYSGGYGAAFSADCSWFARVAAGTPFAFPRQKLAILASYVLDGQQWMVRGRRYDWGVIGRQISRPHGNGARGLAGVCRNLIAAKAPREDELRAFLKRLEGKPGDPERALSGNRHFWNSDFMVHHRPAYYTSARMVSKRIVNTDNPCNQEGLLSHHLADGANFLMRTGEEYTGIFPVWDWQRVPGVTVEYTGGRPRGGVRSPGKTSFVGGVSDGDYGCAAMNFARGALTARKAWFFFDDESVCLGAGISCKSENPVLTSVNQCLLDGAVRVDGRPVEKGKRELAGPTWVHHDGVGYVFPGQRPRVVVRNAEQTGSWYRLRRASARTKVTRDVFSVWLEHGVRPVGARSRYLYFVVPGAKPERVKAFAAEPPVTVLRNTPDVQAVRHPKLGLTLAAFYKPGSLEVRRGLTVEPDRPCLLLVRERADTLRVAVAQPGGRDKTLTVTTSRRLTGEGCTPTKHATLVSFRLPRGDHAGESIVRDLAPDKGE